jgi:hypothetical protein
MNLDTIKTLFGVQYEIKDDELHVLCPNPIHGDRHLGNFSINLKTGKSHCFVCGYSPHVKTIIRDKGYNYQQSEVYWHTIQKPGTGDLDVIAPPIDDFYIRQYRGQYSAYACERCFNYIEQLKDYEVWSDDLGNPAFFVKDFENKYRALWIKDLACTQKHDYFLIEPRSAKRDGWLFGMHLPPTEYTVLVEGFFDALAVRAATGLKTVAMMGTMLTHRQLLNLKKMQPVVVLTDFDEAGRKARNELHTAFYKPEYEIQSYFCGGNYDHLDPDQLTPTQLLAVLDNKKSWLDYFFMRTDVKEI